MPHSGTMSNIAKPILALTLAEVLYNLSGYVVHAVAGRILGPADYGRYGLVITLTTTVIILIGNGVPTAMSRYLSEAFIQNPGSIHAIKRAGIILQTLIIGAITLIFFFFAPIISRLLGDSSLTPLFQLSSLIIPAFAASSFYFYYFTGIHRFHTQATLKIARALLRATLLVALVVLFKIYGAIVGYILVPFLTFTIGTFFDRRSSTDFPPEEKPVFSLRKLLSAAWPITFFLVFYEIFISIDLYLVKAILHNDQETGFYNAALTLGRIPYYLFYALSIVLLPTLAKLNGEGNPEKISKLMTSSLRYAGIILIPIATLLFAYAEQASSLFFGQDYVAAAPALEVLAFGLSCLTVFYIVATGLIGLGRAKLAMWLAIAGTAVDVLLNILAIKSFGILGAAWATAISSSIVTLASLIILQSTVRIPYLISPVLKTIIAGLFLVGGTLILPSGKISFLFSASILGIAYIATLHALGIIAKKDLEPISSLFRKNRRIAEPSQFS